MKMSVRDESTWVVTQLYMEAMLGISLFSYPYLKLPKMLCLSYYCLCFLFNEIRDKGQNRFCLEGRSMGERGRKWGQGGEMPQTINAHVNK
jgi:hypothetical protein